MTLLDVNDSVACYIGSLNCNLQGKKTIQKKYQEKHPLAAILCSLSRPHYGDVPVISVMSLFAQWRFSSLEAAEDVQRKTTTSSDEMISHLAPLIC